LAEKLTQLEGDEAGLLSLMLYSRFKWHRLEALSEPLARLVEATTKAEEDDAEEEESEVERDPRDPVGDPVGEAGCQGEEGETAEPSWEVLRKLGLARIHRGEGILDPGLLVSLPPSLLYGLWASKVIKPPRDHLALTAALAALLPQDQALQRRLRGALAKSPMVALAPGAANGFVRMHRALFAAEAGMSPGEASAVLSRGDLRSLLTAQPRHRPSVESPGAPFADREGFVAWEVALARSDSFDSCVFRGQAKQVQNTLAKPCVHIW